MADNDWWTPHLCGGWGALSLEPFGIPVLLSVAVSLWARSLIPLSSCSVLWEMGEHRPELDKSSLSLSELCGGNYYQVHFINEKTEAQ